MYQLKWFFLLIKGSYNCYTEDIPKTICSDGRYLTILLNKKELSHDGYDFSLELREMTQSKYLRQVTVQWWSIILLDKKQLSHNGHDFSIDVREMTQNKYI